MKRWFSTAAAALVFGASLTLLSPAVGQPVGTSSPPTIPSPPIVGLDVPDTVNVIVPQARRHSWRIEQPRVELATAGATVAIDDQLATTTLELALRNTASVPQEAALLIPVPEGATIRSFQYDGTGPEPTAKILPKEDARRLYDSIVSKQKDPGLLEFAGLNVIKSSVFPIPANTTQSVRIVYEQVLSADAGRLDYVLPRSESLGASGATWTMKGTIKHARGVASVYSPSHDLSSEIKNGVATFSVSDASARAGGALRLSVMAAPAEAGSIAASVFAYPDPTLGENSGYFMLIMSPPGSASRGAGETALKRDLTIVIDRSGSMRGEKMQQAKDAAVNILQGLEDGESFSIIDYSDSLASFAPSPTKMNAKTRGEGIAYVKSLEANGGTNIHDAVLEALRPAPAEGSLPLVLFLTDGLPTVGETRETAIREAAEKANAHKRRLFTFGVGYDVNSPLLSNLARVSRGAPTFVMPSENVEQKVSQVFRRLQGPVLASPVLTALRGGEPDTRMIREVLPGALGDVFEGDQVIVVGQYFGTDRLTLRLSGERAGGSGSFDVNVSLKDASARQSFVPRTWATRKIAALIAQVRDAQAGGDISDPASNPKTKELVDEIVRLSLRWGIMTEYTSFIATEPSVALNDHATIRRMALDNLAERAVVRAGAASVNQEANLGGMAAAPMVSGTQLYLDKDMKEVEITTVQMVGDQTFYRRGARWVDQRVQAKEADPVDETIDVGTARFAEVLETLREQNLLGVLALEGEVEVQMGVKRVLIRNRG